MWGVNRRRKGTANSLAALKSIRAACPDSAPIDIILDNLSAHTGADICRWAKKNKVELCFTPTYAPLGQPNRGARRPAAPVHLGPPTIAAIPRRSGPCTATCAGATPTLATPTYSPPSARNAPASAAKRHPLGRSPSSGRGLITRHRSDRPGPGHADAGRAIRLRAAARCASCLRRRSQPSPLLGTMPGWPPRGTA